MNKLKISAFSDEYADGLVEQCSALSRLGIDYMEMRGVDGKNVSVLTKEEVNNAKAVLSEYGIKVSAIGSPLGKIKLDGDICAHTDTAKRVFETALELGAKNIRMFSFYLPDGKSREDCKGQVIFELEKLVTLANEYGVTLCHENEALIYGESPEKCLEILEYFGGDLRCVFDMGNFVLDGCEPYPFGYSLLRDYIDYFHIKDSLAAGAIVPPGLGEARIAEILAEYLSEGEDFVVTLEPHLETFSGLNALVGKSFENPYKFESPESAFDEAAGRIKSIIASLAAY